MRNELLTDGDVARLLKLSRRQVWKLLAMERICKPVRMGRSVRWRAADIEWFIAVGCDMAAFDGDRKEVV